MPESHTLSPEPPPRSASYDAHAAFLSSVITDPAYHAILAEYRREFQPANILEEHLVSAVAASKWREQRSWTLECATLDYAAEAMRPELAKRIKSMDEAVRAALAFTDRADNSSGLEFLQRYESRHTRTWRLALKQLRELQSAPPPSRRCRN